MIDSPPIASFTDGVLISSLVDGVLLVVHGGKTSRQVVRRTRQMLQEIGAKIIGVVLNKADVRSNNYYYHYDYKNYYSQGDPNAERACRQSLLNRFRKISFTERSAVAPDALSQHQLH